MQLDLSEAGKPGGVLDGLAPVRGVDDLTWT